MALKRIQEFSKNVAVHQQLGDNPNTDDNLSASELKATFDRPAEDIKEYVNGTLVPAIQELEEYGDSVSADLSDKGKEITEIKQAVIGAQGSANQAAFNAAQAAGMAEEAASASRDASAAASAAQTAAETASTDASMAASDAEAATQAASAAQAAADQANANAERAAERAKQAEAAAASAATEASKAVKKSGDSMSGPLSMEGNKLTGLPDPSNDGDAVSKGYLNTELSRIQGAPGPYYTPTVTNPTPGLLHIEFGKSLTSMPDIPGVDVSLPSGEAGDDGGYYIPKISQTGINTMQMGFDPSKPGMTSVQPRQIVLPKGDPGQDGVSPTISITTITGGHRLTITDAEGPKSADILDGATPALQIGTVTTLPAGSPATAEITGTAANPVLSFGLPRGADATGGSAGVTTINGLDGAVKLPVSGSCICNSNAADKRKVLTGVTAGFDPSADGAILAVQFKSPGNTASGPELQIGQTVYTILHPGNLTPPAASALKKSVHHFSMRGSTRAAILLDPYVAPSTVNVDATLTQSGQAADAKIVGSALATRVPAAPLDSDAGKVATVGSDGIPRWETLPAVGSLFGRCSTAACDAAKKATYIDGSVAGGTIITVEFVNANEAENPTLTANGVTGAIVGRTLAPISATSLTAGVHRFVCLSNYNKWMMLDAPDELEYIGEYTLAEDVGVWEIASDLSGAPLQLKKMYFELHIQPAQVNIDNNISNTHARMTVPTWANAYGVNTCVSGYPMLRKTAYKENPGWGQLWEIRTLNGRNVVFRRSKGASCAATVSAGEAAGPGHITGLGLSSLDPTKAQFGAGSTVKIWGAKI
nr:MAG TPA: hypothetical protein [Caudoviricetes sp.]